MTTCEGLVAALRGKRIEDVRRRGKFMIVSIEGTDRKLVFHFGMAGSLVYTKGDARNEEAAKYGHLVIRFSSGDELVWTDRRKFGRIYLVERPTDIPLLAEMGPEPLDMAASDFMKLLGERQGKNVKAFLMDQRDIAGIGNEYSNEILYRAAIAPTREIGSLSTKERQDLYKEIQKVLKAAIRTGPPDDGFGKEWLIAHTKDRRCPSDPSHTLVKKTIAGRSAYYCPVHQR
jgi:formamidopyrimidine-DNA glycosylase